MSKQLSNLPQDVIFHILSKLPTKSLLNLRSVSKSYPPLISHPHFLKLHLFSHLGVTGDHKNHILLHYESTDYTTLHYSIRTTPSLSHYLNLNTPFKSFNGYLRIVGSIKGIICLFDTNYFTYVGTIILWNPSVRKLKVVQDSHLGHRFRDTFSYMLVGFGFASNDFKVVQILYDLDHKADPDVLIYAVGDGFWRKIEAVAPCLVTKFWSNNVFVNGCVHWMAYKRPKFEGKYDCVMAFDMSDELFRVIELPISIIGLNYDQLVLCPSASQESLCLFIQFRDWGSDRWEVWIMNEYGVAGSWMQQFSILQVAMMHMSLPLGFMISGEVLLVMNNGNLVSYDPKNQQTKDLEVCGLPSSFRVVGYAPSLAMLDGGDRLV